MEERENEEDEELSIYVPFEHICRQEWHPIHGHRS
jgi:hypothetical protein